MEAEADSAMCPGLLSICGHGISMLGLAMKMSAVNIEQMKVIAKAIRSGAVGGGRAAAERFLRSTYYKSWSRAQLNNTEYAPMLSLLILCIKYRADREQRQVGAWPPSISVVACTRSKPFFFGL